MLLIIVDCWKFSRRRNVHARNSFPLAKFAVVYANKQSLLLKLVILV